MATESYLPRRFPGKQIAVGVIGAGDLAYNKDSIGFTTSHISHVWNSGNFGWLKGTFTEHPASGQQGAYTTYEAMTPSQIGHEVEVIGGMALAGLALLGLYRWLRYPPRRG